MALRLAAKLQGRSLYTWVRLITSVPEFAGKLSKRSPRSIFLDNASMGLNWDEPGRSLFDYGRSSRLIFRPGLYIEMSCKLILCRVAIWQVSYYRQFEIKIDPDQYV